MTRTVWGVSRRAGAVVLAAGMLSGCWIQVGFAADHARHNVLEAGITRDSVASLREAWSVDLAGTVSEPIASGSRVYLTRSFHLDASADVHAVDAATGAEVWEHVLLPPSPPDPDNVVIAPPVAFSGAPLWAGVAGIGLGFSLVTLAPGDGSVLTSSPELATTSVVTGEGIAAYVRVDGSVSTLVVRDPDTAAVQWTGAVTRLGVEDIALSRGRIYVPDRQDVKAFATTECGAATCAPVWSAALPSGADARHLAVASDGSVLVPYNDGVTGMAGLLALDGRTGEVRWTRTFPEAEQTVAAAGDSVYLATNPHVDPSGAQQGENALVALSLVDGSTRWLAPLAGRSAIPLVAAGVVYTASANDLVALDAAGCGADTCAPLATFPDAGVPRSIGEGRLYTTTTASDFSATTLRALVPA